jgi:hypothetical protein
MDSDGVFPTLYKKAIDGSHRDGFPPSDSSRVPPLLRPGAPNRGANARPPMILPSARGPRTAARSRRGCSAKAHSKYIPIRLSALTKELLADPLRLPNDPAELSLVKAQLISLREQDILFENYIEAQDVQRLLCAIDQKLKIVSVRRQEKELQKGKFGEIHARLCNILNEWNAQFAEFVSTTELEVQSLNSQHTAELDAFDASIPQELTPQYRKRSQALVQLRDKERALALHEKFLAAQKLKMANDAVEDREALEQYNRMQSDFDRRRRRLLAKHDDELKVLMEHAESTRMRMILNRNRLVHGYLRRLQLIGGELGDLTGAVNISEERKKALEAAEAAYPIPLMQSGFSAVRQRFKQLTNQSGKSAERPVEDEERHEEEENLEGPPSLA